MLDELKGRVEPDAELDMEDSVCEWEAEGVPEDIPEAEMGAGAETLALTLTLAEEGRSLDDEDELDEKSE